MQGWLCSSIERRLIRSQGQAFDRSDLLGLPLGDLRLVNVPQLVDAGRFAGRNALGQLNKATNSGPPRDSILCSLGLDPDHTNTRVLWATIVLAVAEVTNPGLQGWRVVLPDDITVGLDRGMARDRSPFAGGVDEANVDRRVFLEVIGLAGLGVGVEEKVEAIALLHSC